MATILVQSCTVLVTLSGVSTCAARETFKESADDSREKAKPRAVLQQLYLLPYNSPILRVRISEWSPG